MPASKEHHIKLILLIFGLMSCIEVHLVGVISISELLAVIATPLFLMSKRFRINLPQKRYYLFLLLWLIGVIISDIYNQVDAINSVKSVGTIIVMFCCATAAIWSLNGNAQNVVYFLAGFAVSSIMQLYYFPSYYNSIAWGSEISEILSRPEYTVLGYFPAMIVIVAALWNRNFKVFAIILVAVYGFASLVFMSRLIFLINFYTTVLLILSLKKFRNLGRKIYATNPLILIFMGAIILVSAYYTYAAMAMQGYLGELGTKKFENQLDNEYIGIASGRADFFISTIVALNNPFFGFGSYALFDASQILFGESFLSIFMTNGAQIPAHSHLIGSWVQAGILALPIWIYSLMQILTNIKRPYEPGNDNYTILLVFGLYCAWNILFSPLYFKLMLNFVLIAILNENQRYLKNSSTVDSHAL